MRDYHFAIVVSVDDDGNVVGTEYDAEARVGSSDGWVWDTDDEAWDSTWDEGADAAYDVIQKMLASAEV